MRKTHPLSGRRFWSRLALCASLLRSLWAHAAEPDAVPWNHCPAEQARVDARCPAVVVLVQRGWVVIESAQPLVVGARYNILSQRRVRGIEPVTRTVALVPQGEQTGMLVLERVRGMQGAGRLVRNAYAVVGDLAVPTQQPFRESLVYGPRIPRTWRVTFDLWLDPLFGESKGLGLLSRAAIEHRFGPPIKLALEYGPGVLISGLKLRTFTSSGNTLFSDPLTTFSGGLRGVFGLALSGFELSVGLGGALNTGRVNSGTLQMSVGTRIGSLDGLSLTLDAFVPIDSHGAGFDSATGVFSIPLHRRISLTLHGGGGLPMWAYGAIGLRSYVTGTGGPGTVILNTSFGGTLMTLHKECPPLSTASLNCQSGEDSGAGPIFHLGIDHRF